MFAAVEELKLPVCWKGKSIEFPFEIVAQGYGYHFVVFVEGVRIIYERDDGGALRAIIQHAGSMPEKLPENWLLSEMHSIARPARSPTHDSSARTAPVPLIPLLAIIGETIESLLA